MARYTICFAYRDSMSNYKWRSQKCSLVANSAWEARCKCIGLYGLDECEYQIESVVEEKTQNDKDQN